MFHNPDIAAKLRGLPDYDTVSEDTVVTDHDVLPHNHVMSRLDAVTKSGNQLPFGCRR